VVPCGMSCLNLYMETIRILTLKSSLLCTSSSPLFPRTAIANVGGRIQISLHHGDTKAAQLRVEEWLAAVPPPYPFPSENVTSLLNGHKKIKDHYSTILELYILSVLPRNEEWEFAREFIGTNEYLSDVKKRVPLPSLVMLGV
jgi:hypothetical protein